MYVSGDDILIYLYMEAQNYPPVLSRNTVAEITGAEEPEKVVACYFAILFVIYGIIFSFNE